MRAHHSAYTEMIAALDDELSARTSDAGRARRRITLVRGVRVSRGVHSVIYRFANQHELRIDEGSEVEVQIDGRTVANGELLSSSSDEILVSVVVDLGEKVDRIVLVIDDVFLLTKLKDRLAELRDAPHASSELATALLGLSRPFEPPAPPPTLPKRSTALNREQAVARVMATRPGVSYLWGPPGTGKTSTLSAIVADYVDSGLRILLLSNTNVAVDVALARVATELQSGEHLNAGRVVRFGPMVLPELISQHGDLVDIDAVIARRGGVNLLSQIAEVERYLTHAKRQADAWDLSLRQVALHSPPDHKTIAEARTQQTCWLNRVSDLKLELKRRRELNSVLQEAVVASARVVATTVYKAYLHEVLYGRRWDVVVIDEASMLPPPVALCAGALAQRSVLIAGDFRQLPPIVEADTPLTRKWLATDLFHMAEIPKLAAEETHVPHLTVLREQHRMHPMLAEVVSRAFYREAPLRSSSSVKSRRARTSGVFPTEAVVAVDTGGLRAWASRNEWGSPYNVLSAQVVAALAHRVVSTHSDHVPSVGAITPYRAQATLLEAAFRDVVALTPCPPGTQLTSGTVHRFQGNEKDIVILDLVSAKPLRVGTWFRDNDLTATGPRMLNVAISRARHQLLVLGDLDWISTHGSSVTRRLLAELGQAGVVIPAASLLAGVSHRPGPGESLDVLYERQPRSLVMQIDSLDLLLGVEATLRRLAEAGADVEVVLRCPRDSAPLDGWSARLEGLRADGVSVYGRDSVQGCLAVVDGGELWGYRHLPGSLHHPDIVTTSGGFAHAVLKTLGRRPLVTDAGRFGEGPCPNCGRLTVRLHGRSGSYSRCPSASCREEPKSRGRCPEPGCQGDLVIRRGRRGQFLGCSTFPVCRYSADAPDRTTSL